MIDPSIIAKQDQLQAAFGQWADMLMLAYVELKKRGVTDEQALRIAQEWVLLCADRAMGESDA